MEHFIYDDPWTVWRSDDERELKSLLKGRCNTSFDLIADYDYESVIELWEPLSSNPMFKVNHPEWQDKPYFRWQIQCAKSHLMIAHAQLATRRGIASAVYAFRLLQEILTGEPFSLEGASSTRLSTEHARIQNLNYIDMLEFAEQWLDGWKVAITSLLSPELAELPFIPNPETANLIPESEANATVETLEQRLAQLKSMMNE